MSADVIKKAFQATEEGFLALVAKQWPVKPQIAAVGSCCLVGVICGGNLYVANLGDSRVVLGRLVRATGEVLAVQLSVEHNASVESIRQELYSLHPDDPHIVVLKHNVWRVKGIIQVLFFPSLVDFCFWKNYDLILWQSWAKAVRFLHAMLTVFFARINSLLFIIMRRSPHASSSSAVY